MNSSMVGTRISPKTALSFTVRRSETNVGGTATSRQDALHWRALPFPSGLIDEDEAGAKLRQLHGEA